MWLLYYLTRIISWPNLCSSHMASDSDAIFLKGYSSHVCQFSFPNAHTLMHFPLSSVFRFQICNFILVCGVDVINQHAHTQLAPILSSQMLADGSLSRSGLLFQQDGIFCFLHLLCLFHLGSLWSLSKVINISRRKFFSYSKNACENLFTEHMFIKYLLCAKRNCRNWGFGEEYVKSMSSKSLRYDGGGFEVRGDLRQ